MGKIKTVNGLVFKSMLLNGLYNLKNNEKYVNSLNVFPVPDGDTGTNMRLTVENGIKNSADNKHFGEYLIEVSKGMLLGARGNSGVILSQLFKGMANELTRDGIVNPKEFKDAFIKAYKTAYQAVSNPVEGTILTVSRVGANMLKDCLSNDMGVEDAFSVYISEMKHCLQTTPDLLPELKEAGVIDSGALGYIILIEGMYKFLTGEVITPIDNEVVSAKIDTSVNFDENSTFLYGYCLEFLLQLLNSKPSKQNFDINIFKSDLSVLGNSIVCTEEGSIIKVHIHTFNPDKVIVLAQKYGEFINFKLENMQIQNNDFNNNKALPHKSFGIIAVCEGEGVKNTYKSLGVDIIIDGGQTMNTSSQEFIDAINKINCDNIVILPNNTNIINSANQAVKILDKSNVTVIETKSVINGYYALALDEPESDNVEYRISCLKDGALSIIPLAIATAVKDYSNNGITCKQGDKILFYNHELIYASNNVFDTLINGLKSIKDISEKSACLIFAGANLSQDVIDKIQNEFNDYFPSLDLTVIDGGQSVYEADIGLI